MNIPFRLHAIESYHSGSTQQYIIAMLNKLNQKQRFTQTPKQLHARLHLISEQRSQTWHSQVNLTTHHTLWFKLWSTGGYNQHQIFLRCQTSTHQHAGLVSSAQQWYSPSYGAAQVWSLPRIHMQAQPRSRRSALPPAVRHNSLSAPAQPALHLELWYQLLVPDAQQTNKHTAESKMHRKTRV